MKQRIAVLTYHQVPEQFDSMHPDSGDRAVFRQQLALLRRYFNVLPLPQAYDAMQASELPPRTVVITFDDGYLNNYTVAFEELQRANLSATFFIATDYLDGGRMWNDTVIEAVRLTQLAQLDLTPLNLGVQPTGNEEQRCQTAHKILAACKYLEVAERLQAVEQVAQIAQVTPPDDLMMSSDQVRQLHDAGMTIGGHTASHPILRRMPLAAACDDINKGKERLTSLLGAAPRFFAYPNGKPGQDYDKSHVHALQDLGFSASFSTAWGYVDASLNPHDLPRVGFGGRTGWGLGLRLLRSYFEAPATEAA